MAAWVRDGVLYALGTDSKVVRLDAGAITDLRADGNAVVWTRDGAPQRAYGKERAPAA